MQEVNHWIDLDQEKDDSLYQNYNSINLEPIFNWKTNKNPNGTETTGYLQVDDGQLP